MRKSKNPAHCPKLPVRIVDIGACRTCAGEKNLTGLPTNTTANVEESANSWPPRRAYRHSANEEQPPMSSVDQFLLATSLVSVD
jgi:hypothetical protein